MKYQLGISTRDFKEAKLFEEYKDAAQQESLSHLDFLSHLMRLHYQWKAEGSPEVSAIDQAIRPTDSQAIAKNMERMAIALEKLVEKAGTH